MLCSVVYLTSCNLKKTTTKNILPRFLFSLVSVLMKYLKFTKDQKQSNKRKLRGSLSGPPESRLLSHSATSQSSRNVRDLMYLGFIIVPYPYNAAVLVVLTVCCREPTGPPFLHCPSHKFGFLVSGGWIWAASLVSRPPRSLPPEDLLTYLNLGLWPCSPVLTLPS